MKALHTFYQFGRELIGGAEYHTYMLSKELEKKGVEVDVLTTKSNKVIPNSPYGISWKNNLDKNFESYDGLKIHRCDTIPLPGFAGMALSYFIDRQFKKEQKMYPILPEKCSLRRGWYYSENIDDKHLMRWTRKTAEFFLKGTNISRIGLEVYCPGSIGGSIFANNIKCGSFTLKPDEWTSLEWGLKPAGDQLCKIELDKIWKPPNDNRLLGILVKKISYIDEGKDKLLSLENDYDTIVKSLDPAFLFENYMQRSLCRPRVYDYMSMIAKGPISPKLLLRLKECANKSDILMGNMVPFTTINYIIWAGKKTGTPTVLLPLFHIGDLNHYWRYFFTAFKEADIILANSAYSKKVIFDRLGIRSEFVGPGVDVMEFTNKEISGTRFREKYGLENSSIILFVARKTSYKRYDMVIEAIQILNEKKPNIKLVMIGPDEDKVPIELKNLLFLGEVDRNELLDAYDACDVFVMPSQYESFGMVFLEAWMREKPVIGNLNCGPVAYLIENGVDGFLCSDSKNLSEQINLLLDDPKLAKKMGTRGRSKVINNHTWDIVATKVKNIYCDLIENKS